MADTIERLYKLTVDGTQAARSLKQIEDATARLDARMASSIDGIRKFGAQLAAAVSIGAVVHGFQRIIDSMDELSKASQKVGIAAEELQRLRYAADLSGVSAEELDKALVKLSQAMTSLDDKGNKAAGVLRSFGVKSTDTSIQALKKFADGLAAMPEGFEKTAKAADLFGKQVGTKMIPLLGQGAEAFEALTSEADKFGGIVSGKTLKAAEEFNDNMSRLARTAAGIGKQLTEGMLFALVGITRTLTEAAKSGDGFVTAGEKIGELIANIAGFAIKGTATLSAFARTVEFIGDLATSAIWNRPALFLKWRDDINALDKDANAALLRLRTNVERARTAFAENPQPSPRTPPRTPVDPLKAAEEAARLAREKEKREKEAGDALERQLQFEKQLREATEKSNAVQTDAERIATKLVEARIEVTKASEANSEALLVEQARLDRLLELFETGEPEVKAWAAAQLAATAAAKIHGYTLEAQRTELDALNESFAQFVNDAASSAGHLSAAFSKMAQTIITELLKIWAKKYILDVVAGLFGVPTKAATGKVFDDGKVVPFARGGVISRPVMFPMALAGEAGPEAILPLKRAANGNLGVQSTAVPLNVTVNNYADATVRTRRTGPNDFEVLVERTRAAIASDLRSGGNLVSKSLEQAYGIGRGAAAAY